MTGAIEFLQHWQNECRNNLTHVGGATLRECQNCKIKDECKAITYGVHEIAPYEFRKIVQNIKNGGK